MGGGTNKPGEPAAAVAAAPPEAEAEAVFARLEEWRRRRRAPAAERPKRRRREVHYTKQQYNWDCGVASLEMVLTTLSVAKTWATPEELQPQRTPPWTIDLAYTLRDALGPRHAAADFMLLTAQPGADESHAELSFYQAEFSNDSGRVRQRFRDAATNGVLVYEPVSLSRDAFAALAAAGDVLLLVLIDVDFIKGRGRPARGRYTGHYVVVTDYDAERDVVAFHDPSSAGGVTVDASIFEIARRARGTDEDLLVIYSDSLLLPEGDAVDEEAVSYGEAPGGASTVCSTLWSFLGIGVGPTASDGAGPAPPKRQARGTRGPLP